MSRPLIPSKETKATEADWSRKIKARDKGLCQFERKVGRSWRVCLRSGTDCAHIYRRWQTGPAIFDEAVGLWACRECHVQYDELDRAQVAIRVPIARARAAWDVIKKTNKVMTIGERP